MSFFMFAKTQKVLFNSVTRDPDGTHEVKSAYLAVNMRGADLIVIGVLLLPFLYFSSQFHYYPLPKLFHNNSIILLEQSSPFHNFSSPQPHLIVYTEIPYFELLTRCDRVT